MQENVKITLDVMCSDCGKWFNVELAEYIQDEKMSMTFYFCQDCIKKD